MTTTQPVAALVRLDQVVFHPHNVRRDLGDLRDLAHSIGIYGLMQPVVVERHGTGLRLRAGHRRVAAAKIAGLAKVPAIVWPEALDEDEWLLAALHENTMRRGIDFSERRDALLRLRELGCSWDGTARSLSVSVTTVNHWAASEEAVARKRDQGRARKELTGDNGKIRTSTLRTFAAAWRAQPELTVDQLLDALDLVAATGRIAGALPSDLEAIRIAS